MRFKEYLARRRDARRKKRFKPVRAKGPLGIDNYIGKSNYVNTPSSLPVKQAVGGFPDSVLPGNPSS